MRTFLATLAAASFLVLFLLALGCRPTTTSTDAGAADREADTSSTPAMVGSAAAGKARQGDPPPPSDGAAAAAEGERDWTTPPSAEQAWAAVAMRRPMPQVVERAADLRVLHPMLARALTNAHWRELLTDEQYRVLREEGTERRGTGLLLSEHRDGTFHCAACGLPLYEAAWKFESGCGWPSFYQGFDGAIAELLDTSLRMVRTENECGRCGSHLGHVFEDAPGQPTGLRYCMNSVALVFVPSASEAAAVDAGTATRGPGHD